MAGPGRRDIDHGEVIRSAAHLGAFTGVAGTGFGGVVGLFKSSKPGLFALVTGMQWFTLGASYSGARQCALLFQTRHTWMLNEDATPSQRLKASSFGGGIAGLATALVFRGPANLIPGAVVCSAIGFGGQKLADRLAERGSDDQSTTQRRSSMMERVLSSKWLPMKKLSDEEYRNILKDKLARVEADIALLDEGISQPQSTRPHSKGNG